MMKPEHRIVITVEEAYRSVNWEPKHVHFVQIKCFIDKICVSTLRDATEYQKYLNDEIISLSAFGEPIKQIRLKKEVNEISITYIKNDIPKLLGSCQWEDFCKGFMDVLD